MTSVLLIAQIWRAAQEILLDHSTVAESLTFVGAKCGDWEWQNSGLGGSIFA